MADKINAHFDFVVQDITPEQARALNLLIVSAVELAGASTGGGWTVAPEKTIDEAVYELAHRHSVHVADYHDDSLWNEEDEDDRLTELDDNLYDILDAKFKAVTKEAEDGNASNETIIWLRGYAQAIGYAKKVVSGEIGDED